MRSSAGFPGLLRPVPLGEPPRRVSVALRLQVLFGGFLNQLGWFLFGFGGFTVVAALDNGIAPTLMASLFPLLALGMLARGKGRSIRATRLLSSGVPAGGRFVGASPTSMKVNDQPVMKLAFEFEARDGKRYRAYAFTHIETELRDQAEEPLLYDPVDPERAVMLDELPGRPRVDDDGAMRARHLGAALLPLVLPVGAVLVLWLAIKNYPLQ